MTEDFLIDTETLAQNLGREGLLIIDVRGAAAYSSHIPGAVHSTWHEYSDPEAIAKGLLNPDISVIERRLQALGIHNNSDVVIYSNPFDNWGDEGRLYWMLQYVGHQSIRILDGGWVKWVAEQRPYEHQPVKPPAGDFKATIHPEVIITKAELKTLVRRPHPDTDILDARSVEEYAGKEVDGLPRAGHIPMAINMPWSGFLNPDATVKDLDAIKKVFEDRGIDPHKEIVTYCLGGVRAAWLYFIMRLINFEHVKCYPGSWWEWSRDFAAPAEKDVKLLHKVSNPEGGKPS